MSEVKLTADQARTLSMYLLLTAHQRQEEIEIWTKYEEEKYECDGSPVYPKAAGNKEFWQDLTAKIEEIIKILDGS